MAFGVFKITDGTTTIDFLAPPTTSPLLRTSGFKLKTWTPKTALYKDGGIRQNSPVADYSRMIHKSYDNATESIELAAISDDEDLLTDQLAKLFRLLEHASDYFINMQESNPVYLEVRGVHESNSRYAIVHSGYIEEFPDQFEDPATCAKYVVLHTITLVLERYHFQDVIPGSNTAIQVSSVDANGYGRAATTNANEVFVGNKCLWNNLTHLYAYDASTATFSANKQAGAVPYYVFPDPIEAGDMVYVGNTNGPFTSVVFSLSQLCAVTINTVQYYNGAGWSLVPSLTKCFVQWVLPSNAFNVANTYISFPRPTDWAATAINGVTAFWIRIVASSAHGAGTGPIQGLYSMHAYSIVNSFIDIAASQMTGDLAALMYMSMLRASVPLSSEPSYFSAVTIAAQVYTSSNNQFSGRVNLSDAQNPGSVTVAPYVTAVFADSVYSASGRCIYMTDSDGVSKSRAYITLSLPTYKGRFRIQLLCRQTGGAADDIGVMFKLQVPFTGMVLHESDTAYIKDLSTNIVLDLGTVDIGSSGGNIVDVVLYVSSIDVYALLEMYELWFIPLDTLVLTAALSGAAYAVEYPAPTNPPVVFGTLIIDDVSDVRVSECLDSNAFFVTPMELRIAGNVALLPYKAYRLWFYFAHRESMTDTTKYSYNADMLAAVTSVKTVRRFKHYRGSR